MIQPMVDTNTHREHVRVGNATLYAGELVDMGILRGLPTPEPLGPKHNPVRFDVLIDELHAALNRRHLCVRDEIIGMSHERQRMVVALNLDSEEGNPEFGMHIGLFTSIDQAWANKFAFGTNVFACCNIALSAEYVFSRKSTKNVLRDLPALMNNGIGKYINHFTQESRFIEHWMECEVSDNDAKDFCWDAMTTGVVRDPRYMLNKVWPRIVEPTHEEHRRGSVYAIMNAFTGAQQAKGGNFKTVSRDSVGLMGFLKQRFPYPLSEEEQEANDVLVDVEDFEVLTDVAIRN